MSVESYLFKHARHTQALGQIALKNHRLPREVHLVSEVGSMVVRTARSCYDLTDHFVEGMVFIVVKDDPSRKTYPCEDVFFRISPLEGACKTI